MELVWFVMMMMGRHWRCWTNVRMATTGHVLTNSFFSAHDLSTGSSLKSKSPAH